MRRPRMTACCSSSARLKWRPRHVVDALAVADRHVDIVSAFSSTDMDDELPIRSECSRPCCAGPSSDDRPAARRERSGTQHSVGAAHEKRTKTRCA